MDAARRKAIHLAMVQLADGDRTAFDVLLDELWPVILSFAERGVERAAAEDVAQEVFYKICSRIADFDRTRGLSWAFGIASYEMMTHRRRLQRRREVADDASILQALDGSPSQEEQLLGRELALAFEEAVGDLTEEDRVSLGLGGRRSGAEGSTLRKRKQRALDRLKDAWRRIYGDA